MACRFYQGRFRFRRRGRHWGLSDIAEGLGISLKAARRGLHAAERAGLLSVSREPGCKVIASVLDLPEPVAGQARGPLRGPIPWSWWVPASRLPGKALQVATICWLLGGWTKSAEFELTWDDRAEFGLSRFSAYRGLDALAQAGLIEVVHQSGRPSIVIILNPAAAPERNGIPARTLDLV
jgi:hypothetical protein